MKVHKIVIPMTAISLLGTFAAYLFLPDDIPVIWNSKGNEFTIFKGILFITALLPFAAYLLRAIPLKFNPKSDHYDKHQKTYETAILTIALTVAAIHWTLSFHALKNEIGVPFIIKIVFGILIIIFGNFVQHIRQNIFTGFNNLWEYSGENAWKKTHKAGGCLIIAVGFFVAASAFFNRISSLIVVAAIAAVVLFNIAYSYIEFRSIKSENMALEEDV